MQRLDGSDYIEFINLRTASLMFRRSQEYLALLIRRSNAGMLDRRIRAFKTGRDWRVHMLDLLDYINAQKSPSALIARQFKQKPATLQQTDKEIAQLFKCGPGVVYRVRAALGLHKNRRPAVSTQAA